jgi:hypothetical protein
LDGCPPRVEFCWYDWFACGCAKPRTVRVLTKYEAEKEVSWHHWEVVDAACCDCVTQSGSTGQPRDVYKPAPGDAQLGDILAVTDEEWAALASALGTDAANSDRVAQQAGTAPTDDSAEGRSDPAFIRLGRILAAPFSK